MAQLVWNNVLTGKGFSRVILNSKETVWTKISTKQRVCRTVANVYNKEPAKLDIWNNGEHSTYDISEEASRSKAWDAVCSL